VEANEGSRLRLTPLTFLLARQIRVFLITSYPFPRAMKRLLQCYPGFDHGDRVSSKRSPALTSGSPLTLFVASAKRYVTV